MSDLISRSALIEEIKSLSIVLGGKQIFSDNAKDSVLRTIDEQPTAYDIDKVVEELRQKKEEVQRLRNTCVALSDLEVCDIENVTYKRAIEIVKHGGVSSDVCECRLLNGYKFLHKTSCDNVFDMERDFKFCPFCGKKIKVME